MAKWDVVITAGQSQMVGHGYAITPAPATNGAFCKEWNDSTFVTVSDDQYAFSPPAAYAASTGSSIPAFCITYTAGTGRPVVIVRSAVDGTALLASNKGAADDWSPTGGLFDDSVARANAAITALQGLGHTVGRIFVNWSQGGKDAAGGNDLDGTGPGSYYQAQLDLLARYRDPVTGVGNPGDVPIKLYIEEMYEVASINPANCRKVLAAQRQAVADSGGDIVFAFRDGSTFQNTPKMNIDGVHYSQAGLNTMGITWANNVLDDQGITEPEVPPTTDPTISPMSPLSRRLMVFKRVDPLPRTFSAAGSFTWHCPSDCSSIDLTLWGAGGGGKGGTIGSFGGGGGGGGEKMVVTNVPVVPGTDYTVVVGAGGAGVNYATAGVAGTGGTTSIVIGATTYSAVGGSGAGTGTGRIGGAGGTGGTGGGTATAGTAGVTAVNAGGSDGGAGGAAGGAGGGAGGAAGVTGSVAGGLGTAPGGGGGGGKGSAAGGHGAAGAVGRLVITRH